MTKAQFVDAIRGSDQRDEDPNLERVVGNASLAKLFFACIYIASIVALVASLYFIIVGVCTQRWAWLWFIALSVAAVAGMLVASSFIGPPTYRHKPLDPEEMKTYRGKYVFIHWLNNVTGYEDDWVPFYGYTEEFVRYHNQRPEICVAPFDQYGRGWVAYAQKLTKEELLAGKDCLHERT